MVTSLRSEQVLLRMPQPDDAVDRLAFGHHAEATRMYGGDYWTIPSMMRDEADEWLRFQDYG